MNPPRIGDLTVAARALLAAPPHLRAPLCKRLIRGATLAKQHRARRKRRHPVWGDGSLMMAASRYPLAREPNLANPEYRACMRLILDHL